jgi:hypothetical protein
MAYTLNGIGTTFYGQREFRADGTYVTTEWIAFLYFPIIPLRSLRVRYVGPGDSPTFGFGSSENYSVYEKRFPNWKQVSFTYGYVALLILWVCFVSWAAIRIYRRALDRAFSLTLMVIAFAVPVPTPWILRHYAMRKLRV